jgi:preprotein translocase subunit SecG
MLRPVDETAHPAKFQSFATPGLTPRRPEASVFTFLMVLLVLDALVLIPVVLLQSGKGGGLAAMGGGAGTDTLFGSRQATTILHKASWWAGGVFVAIAFALSLLSARSARPTSVLRQGLQQSAPAAPAAGRPAIPGVTQTPAAQNQAQGTGPAPAAAPAPAATQGGNDAATSNAGQPAAPPSQTPPPANQPSAPRP